MSAYLYRFTDVTNLCGLTYRQTDYLATHTGVSILDKDGEPIPEGAAGKGNARYVDAHSARILHVLATLIASGMKTTVAGEIATEIVESPELTTARNGLQLTWGAAEHDEPWWSA